MSSCGCSSSVDNDHNDQAGSAAGSPPEGARPPTPPAGDANCTVRVAQCLNCSGDHLTVDCWQLKHLPEPDRLGLVTELRRREANALNSGTLFGMAIRTLLNHLPHMADTDGEHTYCWNFQNYNQFDHLKVCSWGAAMYTAAMLRM